jgi:hypothetical protein
MPHSGSVPKSLCFATACALGLSAAHAYELKFGTNLPPVDIHGFLSQGFLYSTDYNYMGDTTRGSFRFTEAGINTSFNPLPRTRISAQAFLFDVGGIGEYEPFLDYASLEYTFNDKIGVRAGRIRKPGGIYNHIQDVDLARTWVLLPQGIYDARWRDFSTSIDGGEFFGNFGLGKAGGLSYEAYAGLANITTDGGLGNLLKNSFSAVPTARLLGIDPALAAGSQIWWNTPLSGLRVGALFQYVFSFDYDFTFGMGPMRSESTLPMQQYSLEYTWNSWTFQAEYQNIGLSTDTFASGTKISHEASHRDAWYVSAAYRFNKWVEAGTYYSEFYPDTAHRGGENLPSAGEPAAVRSDGFQKDWAFLSLRFDPADWLILKAEGHYIRGTGLLQNNADNPSRTDNGWFMLATKATISF